MKSPGMLMYLSLYFFSFLLVLTFEDWFLVWMGLELNMLSFLVLCYDRLSMESVESSYKYFFVQSVGSGLLLISIYAGMGMSLVLSLSMGMGPFFFWYVSVVKGMSWMSNFFLMIFQKVMPMMLLVSVWDGVMWIVVMVSVFLGGMGMFFETSMKGIMAFSSLNQMGWMMMMQSVSEFLWMVFFLVYGVFMFLVTICLDSEGVFSLFDVMSVGKSELIYVMLMLSGIPPFVGFFLKILVLQILASWDMGVGVFLIMVSLLMFYVYIRVLYRMMVMMEKWSFGGSSFLRKVFMMDLSVVFVLFLF